MTRRLLLALIVLLALTGCSHSDVRLVPPSCSAPAGGRCAQDVAWPGAIHLSPDGRRLYGRIVCGGSLTATGSPDRVVVRLHLSAMGPGTMSCAVRDVGVRLASPLDGRPVVDAVSGHRIRVVR